MALKAREVELVFKQRGSDKGALFCVQKICEEQAELRQMLTECAQAIDALGDLASTAATVAGLTADHNKSLVEQVNRMRGIDIDAPDYNLHDTLGDGTIPGRKDDGGAQDD